MSSQNKSSSRYLFFKLTGALLLILYYFFQPFVFDKSWFLLGLLIAFTVIMFYLLTVATFDQSNIGKTAVNAKQTKSKQSGIWEKSLPAAEDGVFLVPLMFIGVNFITVAISAVLYSAYLAPSCSRKFCVVRGIAYFLVALLILPHGIWPAVLTNITVEIAILTAIPMLLNEQTA